MNKQAQFGVMLFLLLIIVGIVAFAFYYVAVPSTNAGEDNSMNIPGKTFITSKQVQNIPPTNSNSSSGEVKTFSIIGTNYKFSINEIHVKKGDTVKINLKSEEGFHDFVIDEFNAKTSRVNTGGETPIEFVADKIGTFEYYCSVGSHRQIGMVGKLVVE